MTTSLKKKAASETVQRLRITIHGAVQGVGFRPFVYILATGLGLNGWVNNSSQGVFIEVEGRTQLLNSFLLRLSEERPSLSFIQSLESSYLEAVGFTKFEIKSSDDNGAKTALVLPDVATCDDCLAEIFDPDNRRYRYPFTNCTNCGPRYSIIRSLPYDRRNTTMAAFEMCGDCRAEYDDPLDRRFHAQPNACAACGPRVKLWDADGDLLASDQHAIQAAAEAVRSGRIVAVKGLGGFHLMTDARSDTAVSELRKRKHRDEKPLAVMFPSVEAVENLCQISDIERRIIRSPESPIVLLKTRTSNGRLSALVAPGNPYLGAMLPYTPLHHLLMSELDIPVIATSGNLSDEPICTDETEALTRLRNIADIFLVHDRPIERHVDDSIMRIIAGRKAVLRRARGLAPLPVVLPENVPAVLAVGAHLKNCIALTAGHNAFISQHIGDLETEQAVAAFRHVIDSFERLYDATPKLIAYDLHPDYLSTKWARDCDVPAVPVQHHYAHVMSCMAENEIGPPALGIAWDGTGFGPDGTIWGSEFLRIDDKGFDRFAHLRQFRLPGGDQAVKEPRRSALAVLFEIYGEKVFEMRQLVPVIAFMPSELSVIRKMIEKDINVPVTSSAGRLFDAVSSIIGQRQRIRFEGQAATELEFIADESETEFYAFEASPISGRPTVLDWEPMITGIIDDTLAGVRPARISAKFHNTLVEMMTAVAMSAGESVVVLSGGCFQNKYLTERAIVRLRGEGFKVHWHQRVPTNDGGIALGQAAATARLSTKTASNR